MSYVVVLPWVDEQWRDECLASCRMDNIYEVDNRIGNIGVAASWNKGIDEMRRQGANWLIIMSAAMRFGKPGGLDFIKALDKYKDGIAVEAEEHYWHLIAFNWKTIEIAGRFDENFYPIYYEDFDYSNRIYLTHKINPPFWRKVKVDAENAGFAHGVNRVGISVDNDNLQKYFKDKWGRLRGEPKYKWPFNDPTNSIKYWPQSERTLSSWDD